MAYIRMTAKAFGIALCMAVSGAAWAASQTPPNDGPFPPNPYKIVPGWAKPPDGRQWGSTAGVDIDKDGVNVWAIDRCGANNCADSKVDPIVLLDPSGKTIRKFGGGMIVFPHGLHVDKDGNVWVTDQQVSKDKKRGAQVFKFSPQGKLLMTLGKPGVQGEEPGVFGAPTDVLVAPNGTIFVTDGHLGCECTANRVVKLSADGKFLKAWGKLGAGPEEMNMPHTLAMDSQGRLFVGDRTNNRIQIFDQEGTLLEIWSQFGRPSGIYIDKKDVIYVTDSESSDRQGYGFNPGVKRGVRIGSAKTGEITAFIPDPSGNKGGSSVAEGVAADDAGNVYGAEVADKDVKKYVKQ